MCSKNVVAIMFRVLSVLVDRMHASGSANAWVAAGVSAAADSFRHANALAAVKNAMASPCAKIIAVGKHPTWFGA